ncbi:conjugal transfer protein TrbH [Rhizobium sp. Root708]|uniref:conjugal transfer protein TrbH n=1 Tax=Rhizobium sp. Root708 TaxID=1736592 RepID=UPI0006FC9445|nr:conjugal transfer protein TrbH [Rhizobium sp. Root708]KRB49185.1 conjugal transfer protein TrbH [Rhizobium sp. Root708]
MRTPVLLGLTTIVLSGCQTPDAALTTNATAASLSAPAAGAIAGDMAARLAEQADPMTVRTITMKNDRSSYAVSLEAALKGWGYTVVADGVAVNGAKPTVLAWSVGDIDGQVFAQLSTPTTALGRAYTPTASGADPVSPLSVLKSD